MPTDSFKTLGLSNELLKAIESSGYARMTPVQAATIPLLLAGHDVMGRSQTGSGKTAAFLLPLLQNLQGTRPPTSRRKTPQVLILAPTRELCEQILQEARKLAKGITNIQTMTLVGGQPSGPQIKAIELGAQIVVGTPGRTLEFLKNRTFDPADLKALILDEADRMLDQGFTEEVTQIIERLPRERQTILFSATFPESIAQLSHTYQKNPQTVNVTGDEATALQIEQYLYAAEKSEKTETLMRILRAHPANTVLIFCRTKVTVAEVNELLHRAKVATRALHGDLEQAERDKTLALFRSGSLRVVVATDVAARGIDIDHLELVINFDLPSSADTYLHRIGRTGRAGKTGTAVTMADAYEVPKVEEIEAALGRKFIRPELSRAAGPSVSDILQQAKMKTIYISGGRHDKIRAGDIVGTLTSEPHALAATEIGKIELHDTFTYVAVARELADQVLKKLTTSKIKGRKFKASYVR